MAWKLERLDTGLSHGYRLPDMSVSETDGLKVEWTFILELCAMSGFYNYYF